MKKLIALLLAAIMVLSMAACSKTPADESTGESSSESKPQDDNTPATYTYNSATSVFPTNWNAHTYQTNSDADILDYITAAFYSFDYNDTMDGFKMVPLMATGDPIDVTAEYVGQYGIEEGDENRVYIIPLRDDLKWEDGTPITANDFVESAKRLLAPEAQNYRADSLYSGNMVIHNAENYLKQGKTIMQAANTVHDTYSEELDGDLVFTLAAPSGDDGEIYVRSAFNAPSSYDAEKFAAYLIANYVPDTAFTAEAAAKMEGKTFAEIKADEEMKAAWDALIGWWQTDPNEELHFFLAEAVYPELAWEEVGMFAVSDTELGIAIEKPLSGFYLNYSLTSSWLIKTDLYDSLTKIEDGIYTNTYGTSAETTVSYGPYKLTSFQTDKQYILTRNDEYFDITEDTYQCTSMVVDYVPEATTRLQLFQEGKLDVYGLTSDDMATYSLSDYCYYATGDSTFAIVVNPKLEALENEQAAAGENINKTILTIKEFRQALSYSLDRAAFCLATSPTNSAAFGLFSTVIISDPDTGTAYRTTEVSKKVIADFWGVGDEYGEGKLYADLDEAIASITGYNLAMAQELFNTAYDKAIESGLMDEDDVVEIKIGMPSSSSTFYNGGYEFLVNNYTEAVKGTKLEGKLTFSRDDTLGNAYGDALKANRVDMLFGVGWTGSALDPYSLIEAYITDQYQYDNAIDYSTIMIDYEIDGVSYTASAIDWQLAMMGEVIELTTTDGSETIAYSCGTADGDPETRLGLLGAVENAVLQNYTFMPIMDNSSAQLKGQKIEFATEDYIFGMGFGGIKYYTFNYTDAEWADYVSSQNGQLDYT